MVMKHSGEFKFDQNIKVAINGMTFWIEDGRFWYSDRVNSCPDRLIAWKYPNERLEVIDAIIKAHAQKYPSVSMTKMREAIPQTTIGRIMEGYELGLNFINDSIDDGMGVLFKVVKWVLILALIIIALIFLSPVIHFLTSLNFGHPD